jgi:hypothetical protein
MDAFAEYDSFFSGYGAGKLRRSGRNNFHLKMRGGLDPWRCFVETVHTHKKRLHINPRQLNPPPQ